MCKNFLVRSLYDFWSRRGRKRFFPEHSMVSWVPMKMDFFSWEVAWDRTLIFDQLQVKGWFFPIGCFQCKADSSWGIIFSIVPTHEFCNSLSSLLWCGLGHALIN